MKIIKRIRERANRASVARHAAATVYMETESSSQNKTLYGLTTFFFLGYATIFYLVTQWDVPLPFPKNRLLKLASLACSCTHATLITVSSALYLAQKVKLSTYYNLLCISMAFFIFDTVTLPLYTGGRGETILMIIHHTAVLTVISAYRKKFPCLIAQGLLSEISQPFLYTGWFLMKMNLGNTNLYKLILAITLIMWAIARVVNFTMIYRSLYKRKASISEYIIFSPVVLMSYVWFVRLLMKGVSD